MKLNNYINYFKNLISFKMADVDVEDIKFDIYNRECYIKKGPFQYNPKRVLNYSQTLDPQKKYKLEIKKFVDEHKSEFAKNETDDEANFLRIKKRKY